MPKMSLVVRQDAILKATSGGGARSWINRAHTLDIVLTDPLKYGCKRRDHALWLD